jgi:hypothetical protein
VAAKFDVAGRLAEAGPAVDNTQTYVWASHLIGYQNADLTAHSAQVRDGFRTEEGMDLRVLDGDCSSLQAVTAAADHAVQLQSQQIDALAAAWEGAGADAANEFLRAHRHAAESTAAASKTATEVLTGLRDALWEIVDKKAAAVTAIDDRRRTERPAWLAAAQTVITGSGDRAAASEVVDRQIKPFVDNDIRGDWLTAMRTATASIGGGYDAATAALTATPAPRFGIPGDLGPEWTPHASHTDTQPESTVGGAPSSAPRYWAPSSTMADPAGGVQSAAPPATTPSAIAPDTTPGALQGASPGTTGNPASDLGGLGQGLGEAMRRLLSPIGDSAVPDSASPNLPGQDGSPRVDEPSADAASDDSATRHDRTGDSARADGEDDGGGGEHARAPETRQQPAVDEGSPPAPVPAPPPDVPTPPGPEAPAPVPPPAGPAPQTPCEIAAEELPQAGQ